MGTIKSSGWLYVLAFLSLTFCYELWTNRANTDLWGFISHGALLHENFPQFPYHDVFSYTAPNAPWIYHEWGSGWLFFQIFRLWDSSGLFWLKCFFFYIAIGIAVATFFVTLTPIPRPNKILLAVFLPLLTYLLFYAYAMTVRCHCFSFLFYGLYLLLLERARRDSHKNWLWTFPLIMMIWVNVHGGFAAGFFLLAVYISWAFWEKNSLLLKQLLALTVLCGLTTLVNPYGFDFLLEIGSAWSLGRERIMEWGNVFQFSEFIGIPYTTALIFILWLSFSAWWQDRSKFPGYLLLLFATGLQGWLHFKLMPLFALTAMAVGFKQPLPAALHQVLAKIDERFVTLPFRKLWSHGLPIAIILAACVGLKNLLLVDNPFQVKVSSKEYPVRAVAYMEMEELKGNVWTPFEWGQMVMWVLYPQVKISMDGRYETVYSDKIFEDAMAYYAEQCANSNAPVRYKSDFILLQTTILKPQCPFNQFVENIEKDGRWHLVFRDHGGLLFSKNPPKEPLIIPDDAPEQLVPMDHYLGDLSRFKL